MNFEILADMFKVGAPVSIVVIGIGGGGSNAVDCMIERGIKGVKFIAVNTDVQSLRVNKAEIKLQIGARITGGLGAGGVPEVGEMAALEDKEQIAKVLEGAQMVFITAGMGGGTGTGAAPVIAQIAKDQGALTVAVVTKPFDYELPYRMDLAEKGITKLRPAVDTLIIIPNQKLLDSVEDETSIPEAFSRANDVLRQGVQGIADSITETGLINIDFADALAVMKDQGDAIMTIGFGSGENRVEEAVSSALTNPLLEDTSIKGATRAFIYVAGGQDFPIRKYRDVVKGITSEMSRKAIIKTGMYLDPALKDTIRVTLIATGITQESEPDVIAAETGKIIQNGEVVSSEEFNAIKNSVDSLPRRERRDMHICNREDLDEPTVSRGHNFCNFRGDELPRAQAE